MSDPNHNPQLLSALQRLAISRQAIVRQMGHAEPEDSLDGAGDADPSAEQIDTSAGTWTLAKQVAGAWWRGHPAHLALDIAEPMLQTYAEKKPMRLLGISAGIGVAVAILRPWRLISVTGLALAALKSAEVSSMVKSLLPSGQRNDRYR